MKSKAFNLQNLLRAAVVEAACLNASAIDIDHLLVAFSYDAGPAGEALRSLGVTPAQTRQATADVHRSQISSLGIEVPDAPPVTPRNFGHELSARAYTLLKASWQAADPIVELLMALAGESSGLIEAILARLGTSGAAVMNAVAGAGSSGRPVDLSKDVAVHDTFVAISPDQVWDAIIDQVPMLEPAVTEINQAPDKVELGSSWQVHHGDFDEPWTVTLTGLVPNESLELIMKSTLNESPSRLIGLRLRPATGGTIVTVRLELLRSAEKTLKKLIGFPLRWFANADPRRSVAWQAVMIGERIGQELVAES